MTAGEVKELLGLEPHPREGGWFIQTYAANDNIPAEVFGEGRYPGQRQEPLRRFITASRA